MDGAVISEEKIESLLEKSREETVFSLFSAIAKGDFTKSISAARSLLAAQVAPQSIFAFLASAFRKFRDYCYLVRKGIDNEVELRKAGINKLGKKDYINARRVYGDNSSDILLSLCAEYDIKSREHSQHSEIIMDIYLYKIFSLSPRCFVIQSRKASE